MGVKAFVQGTKIGKHLYKKHEFVAGNWIGVPVKEDWRERPVIHYFNLERPAKGSIMTGEV